MILCANCKINLHHITHLRNGYHNRFEVVKTIVTTAKNIKSVVYLAVGT